MRHDGTIRHGGYRPGGTQPTGPGRHKRRQRERRDPQQKFARLIRELNQALDDRFGRTINQAHVTQLEHQIDRVVERWEAPM